MKTAAPVPSSLTPEAEAGAARPRHPVERPNILTGLHYAALGLLVALITLMSLVPAVMGWAPLTILSGSMAPSMPAGSLAVVAPIDEESRGDIPIGTVITYMPHPDSDELVTHRVIMRSTASDGGTVYTLKGDANESPDPGAVAPAQIRAERKYSIPLLGRVTRLLTPEVKSIGRLLLAGALVVYAAQQILQGIMERRRERRAAIEGRGPEVDSGGRKTSAPGAGVDGLPARAAAAPKASPAGAPG